MKRVPQTVWILGLASFFTDFSSEMIYPLLPIFLSSILHAGPAALGVIEGVAEATASLLKVFSGIVTDRMRRRKPLVVLGYSLSTLFKPFISFASSWYFVLVIRFFDRVGKGIRTSPRDALIADVTENGQRGAAYGVQRAMDHAGAVVGPLAASALLLLPNMELRQVFLLSAIPGIIAVGALVFGVKEERAQEVELHREPFSLFRDWRKLDRRFRILLLSLLIFTLGSATDAFLLVRLSQSGVDTSLIAVLWAFHNMVKMISTYFGGKITDKINPRRAIVIGWLFYAAIYVAFAVTSSPIELVVIFLLYGIFYGLTEPAERALVADSVPETIRGTAFGYFHFTVGVGALPASLLFGFVWQQWGVFYAFILGATLACIAAFIFIVFSFQIKKVTGRGQ